MRVSRNYFRIARHPAGVSSREPFREILPRPCVRDNETQRSCHVDQQDAYYVREVYPAENDYVVTYARQGEDKDHSSDQGERYGQSCNGRYDQAQHSQHHQSLVYLFLTAEEQPSSKENGEQK